MSWKIATSLVCVSMLCACNAVESNETTISEPANIGAASNDQSAEAISEIKELEKRWSEAFVNKNYDFIENIVAPDFNLIVYEGEPFFIPRRFWMMNTRKWDIQAFSENVLDVVVIGETAVATVEGSWRVVDDGKLIRDDSFFLTDTWIQNGDGWQVIRRHSQPHEDRL